ncbi:S41 family peptidase [Shewanella woodyi]|uniref:S41 family peptidase n=1 Tax=Shewanella woodyi TaxID=60961 RepID=UPI003748966B
MRYLLKTKLIVSLTFICLLCLLQPAHSTAQIHSSNPEKVKPHLSDSAVRTLIDDTFTVMQQHYIAPKVVASTKQFVVSKFDQGQYASISSLEDFAEIIGKDIRNITGDVHLSLFTINPNEKVTHILKHETGKLTYNFAFEQVSYLDGNIGYLKFNKFHSNEKAKATADAAFNFLKQSDGMIIDLRDTIGGSPDLVQYLLSYFLPKNTPLWEVLGREHQLLYSVLSNYNPKHQRFQQDYPIWILTSRDSASATEVFTGVMQANNKAKIVGETTAGAGYYVGVESITSKLIFRISLSKPVISINKQNWEKIGIKPDVNISSMDALNYARRIAYESVTNR